MIKKSGLKPKAFYLNSEANYLAVVPMTIYIEPGRQYKDGTRQWLVFAGPLNATSKEKTTLFTIRGTKEDAEKELVKYLETAQKDMAEIIQNDDTKLIEGE